MNTFNAWSNGLGPLSDFRREMDRLFDTKSLRTVEHEWSPACDVEEAEDHYLLTLDMPGVSKDQIKLEFIENQILISGERRHDQKKKTDGAWYSERRYGKFHRSFTLPAGVDGDKVEANYQDGTLKVYVPKAEASKPRQIKIGSGIGTSFFGKLIGQSSAKEKEERHSSETLAS